MRVPVRQIVPACLALAVAGCAGDGEDRFPTSEDFPPTVMRHETVTAPQGWKLSTLITPRQAPWRVVVITGTPSWSEYWAPVLAALPADFSMVVADRPGFALSEPAAAVGSIAEQARALSALLPDDPEQKTILVGQSYGSAIATLIARDYPDKVDALVLVSPFMGARGKTAGTLMSAGAVVSGLLPRDLKNARIEVKGQAAQLEPVRQALGELSQPLVVIQGDADTFVAADTASSLVPNDVANRKRITVSGGDHFLNACCVTDLIGAITQARDLAVVADKLADASPIRP